MFINLPIFKDLNTKEIVLDKSTSLFPDAKSITPNYRNDMIHLDAMGFGMGCCCLQITFQARERSEARRLYDQLAIVCPILLALTASTPIYRGILADVDCRWDVISALVDDRTTEERKTIPKSRYASISRFIGEDSRMLSQFNDLDLPFNECCYEKLKEAGFDDLLARHFAWLFIRDPLVVYKELIEQDNSTSFDHFENIQSTNWQTMRFKPPPPENPATGWRVEFRPMEVQLTEFENAAFCVFIVLLTRVILSYDLNFYIPISTVDENMATAQRRDALLLERFSWRCDIQSAEEPKKIELLTVNEIMNGTDQYVGLLPLIHNYLDTLSVNMDTREQLDEYLKLIEKRSTGELVTPARWMRNFVTSHSEYQQDSIVSSGIAYDLVKEIDRIVHESMKASTVAHCCSYGMA